MIIFEIGHSKYLMDNEEQAMKAFEVFKTARPIDWDHKLPGAARYKISASHPEVTVSIVPDEQLLEDNGEKAAVAPEKEAKS